MLVLFDETQLKSIQTLKYMKVIIDFPEKISNFNSPLEKSSKYRAFLLIQGWLRVHEREQESLL
jgi:hypothetical protein